MSKVLFFGFPFHGHTNPTLGLVKELVERGEQIIYYSEEPFRERIENTGACFREYKTEELTGQTDGDMSFTDGVEEWMASFSFIVGYGQIVIRNMFREIQNENPDYIVHDSCAYWGKQIATILNIPAVASITTLVFDERMMGVEPELFLKSVLRISLETLFKKYGIKTVSMMLDNMAYYLKTIFEKDIDIRDLIVPREKLNIVYTSRQFQIYEEFLDDTFKFIGPSIVRPEQTVEFPFDALTDKPLVYISLGTIFNRNADFYKMCIEAFRDTELQVVMAVGNSVDIKELGKIPVNYIVRNYLPQLEILKRASIFISHAGMNSTSEGIYFNVPLVLFPQGNDQFLVAERVEKLGIGLYVRDPAIKPVELQKIVASVLANPAFQEKSAVIAESFKLAGGYKKAVDAIFSYKAKEGIQ